MGEFRAAFTHPHGGPTPVSHGRVVHDASGAVSSPPSASGCAVSLPASFGPSFVATRSSNDASCGGDAADSLDAASSRPVAESDVDASGPSMSIARRPPHAPARTANAAHPSDKTKQRARNSPRSVTRRACVCAPIESKALVAVLHRASASVERHSRMISVPCAGTPRPERTRPALESENRHAPKNRFPKNDPFPRFSFVRDRGATSVERASRLLCVQTTFQPERRWLSQKTPPIVRNPPAAAPPPSPPRPPNRGRRRASRPSPNA